LLSPQLAKGAAAAGVAAVIATQPAFAGNAGNGEQVFNANCAACHAGGQNVIMPEKTLEKEALDQYLAGGRNEKSIITQVSNGKNAMPAFGGRLSDDEIADVAAYVLKEADAGWD
jgi:cytochrome c6